MPIQKSIVVVTIIAVLGLMPGGGSVCLPDAHPSQHSSRTETSAHHEDCPQGTALSAACCMDQAVSSLALKANLEAGKAVLDRAQTVAMIAPGAKSDMRLTASYPVPGDHSPPLTQLRI